MKRVLIYIYLFFSGIYLNGQNINLDSLLRVLDMDVSDSTRIHIYKKIGYSYQYSNQNKAIEYLEKGLDLSQITSRKLDEANIYYGLGFSYIQKGDFAQSLDHYLRAARLYENMNDTFRLSNALLSVVSVYTHTENFPKQNEYLEKTENLLTAFNDSSLLITFYNQRGILSDQQGRFDSALYYLRKAENIAYSTNDTSSMVTSLVNSGLTYKHIHKNDTALVKFKTALQLARPWNDAYISAIVYNNIGATYAQQKHYILALDAFNTSITFGRSASLQNIILENYRNLADMYGDMQQYKNQVIFIKKYHTLKDSIYSVESKNQLTQLEADYVIEKKNLQIKKTEAELQKNKILRNIYLSLIITALIILGISIWLYRRIKAKNELLESKNGLINRQKDDLQKAFSELKSTQAQLIQSEKMASLGELTAGIAHEIQNPLNFVNNFSEISMELLDEMKEEIKNGEMDESIAIVDDIKQNLEKINVHGKRADAIVKGMLQHSRTSSGQKEPTDINALCDEYLRLSYHGLRAKDKSFNADFKSDLDDKLPKINVIPQDFGRVLLNLINNAFYAVDEKAKKATVDFKPMVTVSTQLQENQVEITVADNGNGIPENIKEKIFQPFFTTKPTGSGTGLGLSLSYDIVKAHGGELRVESIVNTGTTFRIQIPHKT